MKLRSLTLGLSLAALVILAASGASATTLYGPTPYLSSADSPFTAVTFQYFYLETFEGALSTPGVTASTGTVLGPALGTDSVDKDDGTIDGFGIAGHSWYPNAGSVTFTFNANQLGTLPTHVGIVWTDVGFSIDHVNNGVGNVTFEVFDALNNSLGVIGPVFLGDSVFGGQTAEDRFFGAFYAGGISKFTLSMDNSSDWEVDHLQYGAVPVPASLLLLGTGLVGLVGWRRFRKS